MVSVVVPESGMNGGWPPVLKKVAGVGKLIPKANCVSRLASPPASSRLWLFTPPRTV